MIVYTLSSMKNWVLFFILIPFLGYSQFSLFGNFRENSELINAIAKAYPTKNNSTELCQFIAEEAKRQKFSDQNNSYTVISSIFLANKIADNLQNFNAKSNQLFQTAINNSKSEKELYIWANLKYGYYLYTYRHYKEALPLFIKCDQELKTISENKIYQPEITYELIGFFMATAQEYHRSTAYLEKARQHTSDQSATANILDNIGLNYLKLNKFSEAENYFNQALILAKKYNNTDRIAKALGNIATLRFQEKKYEEAKNLFLEDVAISEKYQYNKNNMYALVWLAKVYLELNDFGNAEVCLQKAENIALSRSHFRSSELEIVQLYQKIAAKKGDATKDLRYRQKADSLSKMLEILDGSDALTQINWETQKENLQYQLNTEKVQREKESYFALGIVLLSAMLIILLFFIMKNRRNRWKVEKADYDKKVLSLALDKIKSEHKLNNSEQTIASFTTYIHEKNAQIELLENEISQIKTSSKSHLENATTDLEKLLESHLMTQENWERFRTVYRQEYWQDYQLLMQRFPDLTDSNQRIAILSSLGITNSEMARILGVTVEGIKKAKQRLRKKYSVEIESYLSSSQN